MTDSVPLEQPDSEQHAPPAPIISSEDCQMEIKLDPSVAAAPSTAEHPAPDDAAPSALEPAPAAAAPAALVEPAAASAAAPIDDRKQRLIQAVSRFELTRGDHQVLLEVEIAAKLEPEALVGRAIRVLWPEDEAWYPGTVASYDPATAQHTINYDDGTVEPIVAASERVRVLISPEDDFPTTLLPPSRVQPYCDALHARATAQLSGNEAAALKRRADAILAAATAAAIRRAEEAEAAETAAAAAAAVAAGSAEAAPLVGQHPQAVEPAPAPKKKKRGASKKGGSGGGDAGASAHLTVADFRPGEVVWAQVKGFPPWPAMVVTLEQCLDGKDIYGSHAARVSSMLPVVYFGTFERGFVKPMMVTPMRAGAAAGFHLSKTFKRRQFAAAICESIAYLADNDQPPEMFPSNDEPESDTEDEAGTGKRPAKRWKDSLAAWWSSACRDPGMPLKVGGSLKVLSLGRVEWLHPAFHDEKAIYPVGYRAERLAITPAGGPESIRHLCEILEAPDDSGPIFRVTPWAQPPVEARTPNKAWALLFAAKGTPKAAAFSNGARQFGLAMPQVATSIMKLENADRCEKFAGWPDGEAPPPPPLLTPDEQRRRMAYELAMCRLPDGVTGVPAVFPRPGTCYVCLAEDEEEEDLVLQCDSCGVFVHMICYGVPEPPRGQLWLCDTCKVGAAGKPPACQLCPVLGGALKRTDCGRWVHPSCAMWLSETVLQRDAVPLPGLHGVITGVSEIHPSRLKLTCNLCRQPHGACVQCSDSSCYSAFHIMCARQAGFVTRIEAESDEDDDEEERGAENAGGEVEEKGAMSPAVVDAMEAMVAAVEERGADSGVMAVDGAELQQQQQQQPSAAVASEETQEGGETPASGDENGQAAANGAAVDAAGAAKKKERKKGGGGGGRYGTVKGRKKRVVQQEQGMRLNGVRLLVYCRRHTPKSMQASGGQLSQQLPQGPCTCAPMQTLAAGVQGSPSDEEKGQRQRKAAMAGSPWEVSSWGAARAMPLDGALSRGRRAPEALAAALAKRNYVQATPLLLGGAQPQAGSSGGSGRGGASGGWQIELPPLSKCTWHPRPSISAETTVIEVEGGGGEAAETRGSGGAEAVTVAPPDASVKEEDVDIETPSPAAPAPVEAVPMEEDTAEKELSSSTAAAAAAAGVEGPSEGAAEPMATDEEEEEEERLTAAVVAPMLPRGRELLSTTERYEEMRASEGRRVVPGKSAIHGWGAFSRVPHARDQMVVEYVGDLVRPSVADARERAVYDSLVGAGTYVFRVNRDHCVDATRAGNLAHLLNHSCVPNCFSRTIQVAIGGRAVDKVVIFAQRDIAAGEELTYDYRFSGLEQLSCNCGSSGCRGAVNQPQGQGGHCSDLAGTLVPRSQVKWPFRAQQPE